MQEDLALLDDIERQLALYREDMARGFELRMAAVEKVLRRHGSARPPLLRGHAAHRPRRRPAQPRRASRRSSRSRSSPTRRRRSSARVNELIDWLVDQEFRQWQAVTSKLAERQRQHASRMLGAPEVGSFHTDRGAADRLGRPRRRSASSTTYDKRREGETIADQARVAVAAAAAAGGAALGLGTLVTIAASTVAADVTGILLASVVLGVGFLIIPARRRRAKATLQEKLTALRARLTTSLTSRVRPRAGAECAAACRIWSRRTRRFVRAEETPLARRGAQPDRAAAADSGGAGGLGRRRGRKNSLPRVRPVEQATMNGADPVGPAGVVRRRSLSRFGRHVADDCAGRGLEERHGHGGNANSWPALTSTAIILPSGAR